MLQKNSTAQHSTAQHSTAQQSDKLKRKSKLFTLFSAFRFLTLILTFMILLSQKAQSQSCPDSPIIVGSSSLCRLTGNYEIINYI
jgi:type VI protein secretion system component VasF